MIRHVFLSFVILSVGFSTAAPDLSYGEIVYQGDINGDGVVERIQKNEIAKSILSPTNCGSKRIQVQKTFLQYVILSDSSPAPSILFEHPKTHWHQMIEPYGDMNRDNKMDFMFMADDDTTKEYVLLLSHDDGYKAIYIGSFFISLIKKFLFEEKDTAKILEIEYFWNTKEEKLETKKQIVAFWDADRETFVGDNIGWILKNCVPVREEANEDGKIVDWLFRSDIVHISRNEKYPTTSWRRVRTPEKKGWVESKHLSMFPPTKMFK